MAFPDGTTWAEALPDDNTVANQIDDYMRDTKSGIRSRLAREHIFSASQTATNEGGHHSFITFQAQTAPTMAGTTGGCLYVASSSAGYALVFINSAGTGETIVNSAGKLAVVTTGTVGGLPICSSANPSGLTVLAGPTSTTNTTFVLQSINDATGAAQAATWGAFSIANYIGILTGTATNGDTIPLPSGFTQTQCKWSVGLGTCTYSDDQHATTFILNVSVDTARVVSVTYKGGAMGYANYIIIGTK